MKEIVSLVFIGMIVALGRYLVSKELMSWRILVGKGILGGALGLVSYPLLFAVGHFLPVPPEAEFHILIGVTAMLSAMGTDILQKAVEGLIFKFTGKDVSSPPQA